MILEIFVCGSLCNNTILLGSSETHKAVLIDPASGSYSAVSSFVKRKGLHLEKILITHSHFDHIADASLFSDIPVYIHKLDATYLEDPSSDPIAFDPSIKGVKPKGFLEEGQKIEVGNLEIMVLHTPGHTPGSVCFYLPKEDLLLSGDTLFQGTMGRVDLPSSNASSMWKSLKKLSLLPPSTRVIPGHGKETSIGKESWMGRAKERFSE